MAQNKDQVTVAVTGAIYSFPTSATVVPGVAGTLPATAVEHGFVSEDGVTISPTRSSSNIVAWQNTTNVRTVITEAGVTIQFTLIQDTESSKELYYGTPKNASTGAVHWDVSKTGGLRSFFIDSIDPIAGKASRFYLPSAEVTDLGEITLTSGDAISYDITITAYKVEYDGELADIVIWEGVYPYAAQESGKSGK